MSQIMFNIIAKKMLAIIMEKQDGRVGDIIPHLVDGGYPFYSTRMTILKDRDVTKRGLSKRFKTLLHIWLEIIRR